MEMDVTDTDIHDSMQQAQELSSQEQFSPTSCQCIGSATRAGFSISTFSRLYVTNLSQ